VNSSTPYKTLPSDIKIGASVAGILAKASVPPANPVELVLKSRLPAVMRPQLEEVFFFNLLQTKWREEIRGVVVQYGVPEIIDIGGDVMLVIRGSEQAQSLFAVGAERQDHLLGVIVWGRFCDEEILVLHLAVDRAPFLAAGAENNA